MVHNRNISKTKIIGTICTFIVFVLIVTNVNKVETYQLSYVNPNFVGDGGKDVTISMDSLDISMDSEEETAVIQYIVKEGDTLNSIATTFGTTVSNLKKINGISSVKPKDKIVVTNEENGILYKIRETQNIKVFADKYNLNLEDLMTLNYISDSTEMLQKGQEIFVNVSEESANKIPGFIDKKQPDLSPVVVSQKKTTTKTQTTTKTTTQTKTNTKTNTTTTRLTDGEGAGTSAGKILKKWTFTDNITNGFYRGYCTWYVATQVPEIFPYVSETKQSRPFGGDAKYWYANAEKAGFSVGKKPRTGAILVYGPIRNPAGHVAIVRAYYPDRGEMLVEDMNYAGKFVVTQRIESVNRSQIIGYIYP